MNNDPMLKFLLIAILADKVVSNQIMYITLPPVSQCPNGESCLTLSTLAANTTNFLNSNTTLIIQPGNHIIKRALIVSHIEHLTLYTNGPATASITCIDCIQMDFINITKLQISGLEFIRCNSNIQVVNQLILYRLYQLSWRKLQFSFTANLYQCKDNSKFF